MKTLNLFKNGLLILLLSVCFISCSKDDDGGKIEEATLIGTWEILSERDYDKNKSTGAISNESQSDYTEVVRYVFKQDGTCEYRGEQTEVGTWDLEGEKLSLAFGSHAVTKYDVLRLNASELVLLTTSDRTTYLRCMELTLQRK
jgi:hypothetical protein